MGASKAWPVVFSPGSAELLTRAALLAVLPMLAEEIATGIESVQWPPGDGAMEYRDGHFVGSQRAARAVHSAIASLLSDLKREG